MELQPLHIDGRLINAPAHSLQDGPDSDAASELLQSHGSPAAPTESKKYYGDAIADDVVQWSRSPIGLIIAVCFTFAVLVQWLLVCLLSRRPISTLCSSYDEDVICDWSTDSKTIQLSDLVQLFRDNARWIRATQVLASGLGVLMIPITTAVCARAAATMATANSRGRSITLMQTLTLANKSWMDPMFFYSMISNAFARRAGNWLVFLSLALTVLGAIIFPLQSLLITRPIVSKIGPRSDISEIGIEGTLSALKFGYGPASNFGPTGKNGVLDFQAALADASLTVQGQSYLDWIWYEDGFNNTGLAGASSKHWTSLWPTTTSTGYLQNYSLGIGSSVTCSDADFPDDCAGENPFTYDMRYPVTIKDGGPDTISIRLCIPGDMYKFPWQSNEAQGQSGVEESKQTITEILYMDFSNIKGMIKSSFKCRCDTTSGYFELPNELNNTKPRAILENYSIPDPAAGKAFTPSTSSDSCSIIPSLVVGASTPSYEDWDLLPSSIVNTSLPVIPDNIDTVGYKDWAAHCADTGYPWTAYHGPLLSSIIVLFTNATNKNQCSQGICPNGYFPPISSDVGQLLWQSRWGEFANYDSTAPLSSYADYLSLFCFPCFENDPAAGLEDILQTMTLLASQTALQLVGETGGINRNGQGLQVVQTIGSFDLERIDLPLWGLVVLSIIIALYVAGMLFLGVWGSRRESWTPTLDALAMLMMGARLHDRLPSLEGHSLDGVASMGKEYDGIPGGIVRGDKPLLSPIRD